MESIVQESEFLNKLFILPSAIALKRISPQNTIISTYTVIYKENLYDKENPHKVIKENMIITKTQT